MKRLFQALTVAATLAAPVAFAQGTALSPQEMRAAVIVSLESRHHQQAADLAEALVARDAKDHDALLLSSRAHRNLGDIPTARNRASQAWDLSRTDEQHYAAALMMAQALASGDQRMRAQFWLRRAAHHAPDERLRRVAVRDFQYVRARTPVTVQLSFNIAPNSNINNGSTTGRSTFFDPFTREFVEVSLGGTALALSGVETSLGAALRYRLHEKSRSATDLTFSAYHQTFALSSSAKATAPGAKGSDFATTSLAAGLTRRWKTEDMRGEYTLGALIGATRYAGDPYAEFARLSAGMTRPLAPRTRLRLDVSAEQVRGAAAPHADKIGLDANLRHRLQQGGDLTWSIGLTDSTSSQDVADYTGLSLGLTHALARPLWGADISYGLSLSSRDYPRTPFAAGGRADNRVAAHLQMWFRDLDYYGFSPVLSLSASRTASNVGLYDADAVGMELGVRSTF